MSDPEIRDLQVATARAYAIAERLAVELETTVHELLAHVGAPGEPTIANNGQRAATTSRRRSK